MAINKEVNLIIRAKDEATTALRNVEGSFTSLKRVAGDLLKILGPIAGALAVKEVIDAKVQWDRYNIALESVFGSSEQAAEEIEFLREVTDRLGISLQGSVKSYTQFSAAAEGTALEGDGARKVFEALATASSALRLDQEQVNGAMTALTQVLSKGKVQAEELRGQLGERIPGAFNLAAKAMGLTTEELSKQLELGNVYADDFLPKFADQLLETYGPKVAAAAESSLASIERFNNTLLETKVAIADAGLFDVYVNALGGLGEALKDEAVTEALRSLFDEISKIGGNTGVEFVDFFTGAINILETFVDAIQIPLAALGVFGEQIGATFAAISLALEGEFKLAIETMASAPDTLDAVTAAVDASRNAFDGFTAGAGVTAASVEKTGEAMGPVASLAQAVAKANDKLTDSNKGVASSSNETTKSLEKQSDNSEKAKLAAEKLAIQMEKIASNERIKNLEFAVELEIAALQADAEKATAIIDNIGTAITSTGDSLNSLFGNLTQTDDIGTQWAIEDQIEKENDRRDRALEQQEALTESQIQLQEAQAKRLRDGGGLINITADGLEPELEAFMFKVIERVQVRVAESAADFLLVTG